MQTGGGNQGAFTAVNTKLGNCFQPNLCTNRSVNNKYVYVFEALKIYHQLNAGAIQRAVSPCQMD